MRAHVLERLRERGIQPSAQRVAIAQYILFTDEHPSADRVWMRVRGRFPMISRATVYNTLRLFAEHGLVRELHLSRGSVVFDANTDAHHHFIDDETGRIYDIPWDRAAVRKLPTIDGFQIRDYQVVMRGRRGFGPIRTKQVRAGAPTSPGRTRRKKPREEKDRRAG